MQTTTTEAKRKSISSQIGAVTTLDSRQTHAGMTGTFAHWRSCKKLRQLFMQIWRS